MKKLFVMLMAVLMVCGLLAGCGGSSKTGGGGTSIEKIRQAAKDAGYTVADGYKAIGATDVTGCFSVHVVTEDKDVLYTVMEFKTEAAAKAYAKEVDDAGYNISIINGKIMGFYSVNSKESKQKEIIESIVKGTPIKNTYKED